MLVQCTAVLGLAFLLSLILPGRRRTLNLPDALPAGVARGKVRPLPQGESTTVGHLVGLACLARCQVHVFTAQLAFSLCSLLGFVQVVLSRNMVVTACNNSRLSQLGFARPQTRQSFLFLASLNPVLRSQQCPIRVLFSCLTARRLLLCPINHHLVDMWIFRNTCAIIAETLRPAQSGHP